MDNFKSQIIHVVETVDKLNLPDRIEALNYLQKITEVFKNNSLANDQKLTTLPTTDIPVKSTNKTLKHKCKNRLCLVNNIKHLKKVVCCKCDRRLENEFQLFDHSQTHLDYPLSCIHCRCTFRNAEDFSCHQNIECKQTSKKSLKNSVKYRCTVCSDSFSNKKTFHSHLLDNHGVKLYNNWYGCKLCRKMFEQKKMLYHHYKEAHSKMMPKKNVGSEESKNQGEIEKFQCEHCKKYFQRKYALSVHMKQHIQNDKYSCDLCKKSFIQCRYYKRHLRTASHLSKNGSISFPLFKCELCDDKIFVTKHAFQQHNTRVHSNSNEKRFKCPLCDFKTGLGDSLKRHVNLHTNNRKFICDQCGACFSTLIALKDHNTGVHSNEHNFSCEICGQGFKLKSDLNRHFRAHSDEKEFKCFCGSVYKFRTNLKRHMVNVHNEKKKHNRVFRVTTENQGYAMNNPKIVQRKIAKQKKTDINLNAAKLDDFDISSLGTLSDVDLSCADDVLRETYDSLAKYSTENGESQENFLDPVNNIIDRVLQGTSTNDRLDVMDSCKQYSDMNSNPMSQHLPSMNYRGSTCRQYLFNTLVDVACDQYSELGENMRMNVNPNVNSSFNLDHNVCTINNFIQDIPVQDESSFSYTRWLNEIL